jgi:hypothetical protein
MRKLRLRIIKIETTPHSRRCWYLRIGVTVTLVSTVLVDSFFAAHLSLLGNLIWLWVDFEDPKEEAKAEKVEHDIGSDIHKAEKGVVSHV